MRTAQQKSELHILVTQLARMPTLNIDDHAALTTMLIHISKGDYTRALDTFRRHFNDMVLIRIDFDKEHGFNNISKLLRQKIVSAVSKNISELPAAAPEPKKPVAAPEPKKPVAAPEPKKPAAAPEPKKPAAAPAAAAPEPKKPVAAPEPKKPVAAPEPKKPAAAALAAAAPERGPFDMNGFFPLFNTIAGAKQAGDGTVHTHDFNGIVYFMPNGVPFYHGDYTAHADFSDGEHSNTDDLDADDLDSGSDSDHGNDDDLDPEFIPEEEKRDDEEFADMRQRYKPAVDCLYTFGGYQYFDNDGANLDALRKYEKQMDAKLKRTKKAVETTQKRIDELNKGSGSGDLQTELQQLQTQLTQEKKDMQVASDNATLNPALRFDPSFANLSDEALLERGAFDQIHIRTWAFAAAVIQMPVGTIFEVAFENGDTGKNDWYFGRITVPNLRPGCLGFEFVKRVGKVDAYTYKTQSDGNDYYLSLVDDTFRRVDRRDAGFDIAEEETLNQDAAALDTKEEDTADDVSDDPTFAMGTNVEYMSAGSLVRGEVAMIRPKPSSKNSVEFPYEYKVKGQDTWVGGEQLHAVLDLYTVGQKVFWNGRIRTIQSILPATSSYDGVAVFKDGESASFDDLDESELVRQDVRARVKEAKAAEDDVSLDLNATYTCVHEDQQHTVKIVRAPYHVYTSEEWEQIKQENDSPEDLLQPEKVDVQDIYTGDTFSVWASDINPLKDTSNVTTDDDSEWDSE